MKELLQQLSTEMRNDMVLSISQDEKHFYFRLKDVKESKVESKILEKSLSHSRGSNFYSHLITNMILDLNRKTG